MSKQLILEVREPSPEDYKRAATAAKPKDELSGEIKTSLLEKEEVLKLYKRAKDISEQEEDEKEFFKREKSVKPPRKGEIVKQPFPPPVQLEKPEQLLKEEEEMRKELKVIRYMPEGVDLETVPQVVVTFNQPMIPLTGVDELKKYPVPVEMTPSVEGEWRWVGTKTVKWKPTHRLPKSTVFKITVPKGVRSELGCELKEPIEFSFTTKTVEIKKTVPNGTHQRVGTDAIIYLEVNQKINIDDLMKHIQVTGGSRNELIVLTPEQAKEKLDRGPMKKKIPYLYNAYQRCFKNAIEGQFVWIGFKNKLLLDTAYTIKIAANCPSVEGPRVTMKEQSRRFWTYGLFRKTHHHPTSDIVPNQGWSISFSNNIELDDFDPDRDIEIEPSIPNLQIIPSGSSVSINGQTKGSTNYIVTLKNSMTDIYGQNLSEEVKVGFSVGRARQNMYGFFNGQMIVHDMTMDQEPKFEVVSINLAKIRVCVYQVECWEFHKSGIGGDYNYYTQQFGHKDPLTVRQQVNCGKLVFDEVITVVNRPDELVTTEVLLTPFLQHSDERCGQLFVYVEPDEKSWNKGQFRYSPRIKTWIQVSHLAVDCFSAMGREMYAFCSSLGEGKPIENVNFTYQSELRKYYKPAIQKEKYENTQVSVIGDTDGTAFFGNMKGSSGVLFARKGNDVCFVRNIRHYDAASGQLLSYIANDRNLYKPKETISVKGIFRELSYDTWQKKLTIPKKGEVKWICYDPRGSKLSEGKTETNEFGSFFMEVSLPDNVNLGQGRIRFVYNSRNFDNYYKVQEFRTPEFEATAKIESRPYFANGVAIVEGKAEYFSGGGLTGCDVNWDCNVSETSYHPPNFTFKGFNFNCSYSPIKERSAASPSSSIGYSPFSLGRRRGRGGRRRRVVEEEEETEGEDDDEEDGKSRLNGKTDGSGDHKIAVEFRSNNDLEIKKPARVTCDLNIQDINRQVMSASASFLVHPSRYYCGIKLKKYFAKKGEALPMDLIVADIDGTIIPDIDIEMIIYNRFWERKGYNWKEKEVKVAEGKFKSQKEPIPVDIKLEEGGTYYFVCKIRDPSGMVNYSSASLWVSGGKEKGGGSKVEIEVAKLIGNKTSFDVGDEAKVLVSSPFAPAEGLMVVICNGFVQKERFTIEEDSTVLTVPIRREYVPNCFIRVFLSGKNKRVDNNTGRPSAAAPSRPAFASGTLSLSVPPKQQTLKVSVEPEKKIMRPGEEGNVSISVTCPDDPNYKGGAGTAVSLIIVDEAVLSLTGYVLPHPIHSFASYNSTTLGCFYYRSSVVMKNWSSIVVEAPPKPVLRFCCRSACAGCAAGGSRGRGRGRCNRRRCRKSTKDCKECKKKKNRIVSNDDEEEEDEDGPGGADENTEIEVRTDFKPLAIFTHDTKTNEDGKIVIPFKLPDNLTRYRVWVLAHNEKCTDVFGLGESAIQAQLPVAIRPSLPRFLNFGDEAEFTVVVQNQTVDTVIVNLAVRMTNLRLLDDSRMGVRVEIPFAQRAEVRFPVKTHKCGTGRFQCIGTVSGTSFADAVEKSLPIFTPSTSEAFATYGEVDGDGVVIQSVIAPEAVYNQFGGLSITTSSTALQSLTDAFLYLYRYKFDCIEQISSRMLSINALHKFLYEFNVPQMPTKKDLRQVMEHGFKKIRGAMRSDGAIGYWSLTSAPSIYLSIFVAHNLIRCKESGLSSPDTTLLNRSKAFCQNVDKYIQSYCVWYGEYSKAAIRAKALYVLTIYGLNNELSGHEKDKISKRAEDLYKTKKKYFTHEGKVWLMFCLYVNSREREKHPIVLEILKWIMNNVEESPETAHFITSYGDDGKLVMLHSNRRTDGVILEVLCHVDPKNYLIPKIVKGLLAHRKKGKWRSTQENVYILMALKKYFEVFENVVPDFLCRVWLGDGYAGEVKFKGRETDYKSIDIPMRMLVPDEEKIEKKDLTIWKQGQGRLYYRLGMDYAPKSHDLKPVDYGFIVERTYEGVTSDDHVKKLENGQWQFKAGELIRVKLRLTNVSRRFHVALVDFLPAGCECLNPELKGTQKVPKSAKSHMSSSFGGGGSYSPYQWRWWYCYRRWYEHVNLRDERVEAFASYLYCGDHEYEYIMRATSLGKFVIPPAKAEEMYSPELFGRSASEKVVIL